MDKVQITGDGALTQGGNPVVTDPLLHLGSRVELDPGFTLRSFFRMIERYPDFSRLNVFLPECLELYRACPAGECTAPGVGRLEFYKTVEMSGFPGAPRLDIYHILCGREGETTCEIRELPLEQLLDLPLRIGKLKHVVFGDRVDVLEFDTVFNLFEFIEGIVWQLSFHRSPKECALRR